MGCGCKNKGNETQTAQPTTQQVQEQQAIKQQQSESVKDAIKKTVEKYYSVNKTTS